MYSFQLSNKFLTEAEKKIFEDFLIENNLDTNIWGIFESLFRSGTKRSIPLLIKAYENRVLCGAAVIIKCSKYGYSIFRNKILATLVNGAGISFYLWIKAGCCMDMVSNPGFVKDPKKADKLYQQMATFLRKQGIMTIIYDYNSNSRLFPDASILPSLPHALIDTSQMITIDDYLMKYKNLKKKMRVFHNKGGTFELITGTLNKQDVDGMKKCFNVTAGKSVMHLPYQDLNLNSASITSRTQLQGVFYFVARLNGQFLGYQAALKTGRYLHGLHGAFDRERPTTFHAYDILFVKMTTFAIEHKLDLVDVGVVLNDTKQRMVNRTIAMSYYVFSKYPLIQWLFNKVLLHSKIQGQEQMKYVEIPN